ncbi:dienelactone hydrolase [Xylariaceae sp. FL1272]|nr:dienelactone hydrolase [Xylariaceae sp. FL1272]
MEINLPNLVNAALPDRKKEGKNAIILSNNMGSNHNESGFLSNNFPRSPPKLFITAEDDVFDDLTLREWRDEGFNVEYLPLGKSEAEYKINLGTLRSTAELGPCETYGIIAYGDAASICLEYFHVLDNNPEFKLCCLVAYYPTRIPDTRAQFPGGVNVLAHLAGEDVGVVSHGQIVGIQGKRRVTRRKIERGLGSGGTNKLAYPSYTYNAQPGFAEHDLEEYEKISAELAWSRSLAAVRKAFRKDVDLEMVLEENVESKFYTRNLGKTMSGYTTHKSPHVTYFPTLTGGIGAEELQRFYSQYFLSCNPPSMKLTLISRTMGSDRVVDELHIAFKHTQEMPWILPGVPPTQKRVEIMVISIVALRGGLLYHEHIYWDQASVLLQVGLLDPKLVPSKAKERGVKSLPVVGREAARRLIKAFDEEEEGEADNELLPGWYDDDEEEEESPIAPPKKKNASQTQNGGPSKNTNGSTAESNDTKPKKHEKEPEPPHQSPSKPEDPNPQIEKNEIQSNEATQESKKEEEEDAIEPIPSKSPSAQPSSTEEDKYVKGHEPEQEPGNSDHELEQGEEIDMKPSSTKSTKGDEVEEREQSPESTTEGTPNEAST